MSTAAERLLRVRGRIEDACQRAGRGAGEVRLVAVSKRHPASAIREAYAAGQRDFGENYAQELADKAVELSDLPELRWHYIGHLQRNKAKLLVPTGCHFHSLDSERLARALNAKLQAAARTMPVLLHVNVAGEVQKSGVPSAELPAVIKAVRAMPQLQLQGLMTMPPAVEDPEQARPHFRRLRGLAHEHGLPQLSMGMTGDMEVAVEEGATLVRVGTAIFGARPA